MKDAILPTEFTPTEPARYQSHRSPANARRTTIEQHSLCVRYMHESRQILKNYDMTPLQYAAILEVWAESGSDQFTVTELARRLDVRHNSAVVLADTLCRKGYLTRNRSNEDGRRVLLQTTAGGDALVEELIGAHRNRWGSLQDRSPDDRG